MLWIAEGRGESVAAGDKVAFSSARLVSQVGTLTQIIAVQWAAECAKRVLRHYEDRHPEDKRPREAIQAALKWAKDPTEANRVAATPPPTTAANAAAYATPTPPRRRLRRPPTPPTPPPTAAAYQPPPPRPPPPPPPRRLRRRLRRLRRRRQRRRRRRQRRRLRRRRAATPPPTPTRRERKNASGSQIGCSSCWSSFGRCHHYPSASRTFLSRLVGQGGSRDLLQVAQARPDHHLSGGEVAEASRSMDARCNARDCVSRAGTLPHTRA